FFIDGGVFYEAAAMLVTFVLLGHWFEMRARGGANDAIRALLDLAPPMAVVVRDGEPVEVPTAEVVVGDLLLVRPGSKVPVDAVVGSPCARALGGPARLGAARAGGGWWIVGAPAGRGGGGWAGAGPGRARR